MGGTNPSRRHRNCCVCLRLNCEFPTYGTTEARRTGTAFACRRPVIPGGPASSCQTIEGFNLTTLQPTWIARFPSIKSRIIRWGTNGLAFFDGSALNPAVIVEHQALGGQSRESSTAFLYVYVVDVDANYARAIAADATSLEVPADMPYGDRQAMARDPWGNTWQIATRRHDHQVAQTCGSMPPFDRPFGRCGRRRRTTAATRT
jgi:glyoxalase/bleomycin resistance protein/dioxygenase superfamily protein